MLDAKVLEGLVRSIDKYLRDVGAVRKAENVRPDEYITWEDLHQIFEFDEMFESSIRTVAYQLGFDWVNMGQGFYIGDPGEQAREFARGMSYARTMAGNMTDRVMAMGKNKKLSDLRKYAREHGVASVKQLPVFLKALGSPLPDEVIRALTSKR